MRNKLSLTALAAAVVAGLGSLPALAEPPAKVTFTGPDDSPISAAVALPAGRALFLTSGTVPPVLDEKAAAGSRERFGDTKTQGVGALQQIEKRLQEQGLGLKDVIYLRVYVTADKFKENKFDFPGWFEAYGQFFGTKDNPVKPARSTMGVAALVNPDWLIEIEAVAAYPEAPAARPPDAPGQSDDRREKDDKAAEKAKAAAFIRAWARRGRAAAAAGSQDEETRAVELARQAHELARVAAALAQRAQDLAGHPPKPAGGTMPAPPKPTPPPKPPGEDDTPGFMR